MFNKICLEIDLESVPKSDRNNTALNFLESFKAFDSF